MFDPELSTNIASGDADLPGILNETRERLNVTRKEADLIPRRNIASLLTSDWNATGGMAEVLKFGPITGWRFIITTTDDMPSKVYLPITTNLPASMIPQVTGSNVGLANIGRVTYAIRREGTTLGLAKLDGSAFTLGAGIQVRSTFTSWSHEPGAAGYLPGVPA